MSQDKNSKPEGQRNSDEPPRLREAIREARIEAAERIGVVVDLRDAEIARLELLNDELDPLFAELPPDIELFDRGMSRGNTPRLWIDAIAHVEMGRDKRVYRFVQDTRFGRRILAESSVSRDVVNAVTRYVAHRLIDRERALAGTELRRSTARVRWRRTGGAVRIFLLGTLLGAVVGIATLIVVAWVSGSHAAGP